MTSLGDVPVELLEPFARQPFIDWLARIPIDRSAKRRLMRAYSDLTGRAFTPAERLEIQADNIE